MDGKGLEEFTLDPDWGVTQRCEINTRLDGVSRSLAYSARDDPDEKKLQKAWVTRLLLNRPGQLAQTEAAYTRECGKGLYDHLEEGALQHALGAGSLDSAYPRYRMVLWQAVAKDIGCDACDQRLLCARLWATLRHQGSFQRALQELAEGVPLGRVLEQTLWVRCAFVRMVLARDLAVLLPSLVGQRAVDGCVIVGAGAADVMTACTEGPKEDTAKNRRLSGGRLETLHANLLELLDARILALTVPQGWTLDLTEHACCELRRWDARRGNKHSRLQRARPGNPADRAKRQGKRLQELREIWQMLGFARPPALVA